MANRDQGFRQHQLTRALRAARAAGVANPNVRISLPNGTQLFVGGGEVTAPPKKSKQRAADFAEGGKTPMAGKGDRTITASSDAAVTQEPGGTAHKSSSGKLHMGGSRHGMFAKQAADPAPRGTTGKQKAAASPKQASGGLSRPARPGECGT